MNYNEILSDPYTLIQAGGVLIILIIIFLETGFLLGLVLPGGDYLVFTAGVLAGTDLLDISFTALLTLMILSAIAGDFAGFAKGRWLGPLLFNKPDAKYFKMSYLDRTESFYNRYGIMAFVLGRFLPVIRTLIPMLAGASRMPAGKFTFLNILGAIIWIGTLMPLGYFLGVKYPGIMDYSIWFLISFIVLASIPAFKFLIKRR
jgi:membrane-associated protein